LDFRIVRESESPQSKERRRYISNDKRKVSETSTSAESDNLQKYSPRQEICDSLSRLTLEGSLELSA
jgi:hypothetical protein